MTESATTIREGALLGAAANAGARAGVLGETAFDARRLANDLAAQRHGVALSLLEKQLSEGNERRSLLLAALNARRASFAGASARFATSADVGGNAAVLMFDRLSQVFAATANWIPAAVGVIAPVLRIRLRWANAESVRLAKKRDELSKLVEAYTTQLEDTFADFKHRAEAVRRKTSKQKEQL